MLLKWCSSWCSETPDRYTCYHEHCVNNEQISLPGNYGSDFEQYLNPLQLYPISLLVNFSHALVQIITTYDFLLAKQVMLSNVRIDYNLTQFLFWLSYIDRIVFSSTFHLNWGKKIMIRYDFLEARRVILRNVRTDS